MPDLTPDMIHAASETLSRLTEYLRQEPDPTEALALVEPLLDEYTGLPIQLADALRALARTVQNHRPDTPRAHEVDLLVQELRSAAWEQTDQHTLHYVIDDLRALYAAKPPSEPGCGSCR
ncbi:hypothetical protein [Streptomyces diastatochromogenes]|uniref:Uncharacterized protein n=1 Tax=Streptomyces diastatochromogenes TaxID=42236 RepID=A0A233RQC6_STRDA|nr:hypothetical protein [Streptomyces diastatochromogenes]MCZ0990336.1 hypothetical protein [Streptomyces diastatochromogenes]OXY85599.1 hypothetical protein BEK98_45540 [Streptomyces diastatochromogenes]